MKKVHRGTLHEMIKNDANKCAKQTETKAQAVAAPASSAINRTQSNDNVDNRHAISTSQRAANKYSEVQPQDDYENDSGKPLSKMDLIKKFDSKYKQSEPVDNKPSQQRSSFHEESQKTNTIPDEVENDENIQNSNNEEINDVEQTTRRSNESESTTVANNNYKNGNTTYGSGANANANGNDIIPPKPLPRTSRNNSVSSLSSEHSISISSNPIEDSTVRPVAKPRTTTTSYKVQSTTDTFYFTITFCTTRFCFSCAFVFCSHTHTCFCCTFYRCICCWLVFYVWFLIGFGFIFCIFFVVLFFLSSLTFV